METNKNLLIAMQVVKDECIKHGKCEDCPVWEHLDDICEPHYWSIPAPPPEPTARPRIEWARMLPDKEMMIAMENSMDCSKCDDEDDPNCYQVCADGVLPRWHEVVTLEQFRKDVGLNNYTDS